MSVWVRSTNADKDGNEIFTAAKPGAVTVFGSLPSVGAEIASAQAAEVATTVETYNRAAGATEMEVYVESGFIRVRTDGEAATATTGQPIGPGFGESWAVESISVYFVADSTITVVSR